MSVTAAGSSRPFQAGIFTNSIIWRTRSLLLTHALAAALLILPDQSLELHIITAEMLATLFSPSSVPEAARLTWFAWYNLSLSVVLLTVYVTISFWLASSTLAPARTVGASRLTRVLIALLTILPLAALAGGFYAARGQFQIKNVSLQGYRHLLDVAIALTAIAAITLSILLYFALRQLRSVSRLPDSFGSRTAVAAVVLLGLTLLAICLWPTQVPVALGSYSLLFLFLSFFHYFASLFQRLGDQYRLPLLTVVPASVFAFAYFDLSDNHQVHVKEKMGATRPIEKEFIKWVQGRPDAKYYSDRKLRYPVYLVATEGGGLYAAYHAALGLARVQELCPAFAHHLFGISSVSGGSLGAAVFRGLVELEEPIQADAPCRDNATFHLSDRVKEYFSNDFLSPLLAGALFPDFVQRVLPFPVGRFDRARFLTDAFAQYFDDLTKSIPSRYRPSFKAKLDKGYFARQLHDLGAPYLFINTTSVATGARVTLSPVFFDSTPTAVHFDLPLGHGTDIRVGDAVGLSARFPWITPAGWIVSEVAKSQKRRAGNRLYLADGGYFENSGSETAGELADRLRDIISRNPSAMPAEGIALNILVLSVGDATTWMYGEQFGDLIDGTGEIFTPIKTLFNTRIARASASVAKLAWFDSAFINQSDYRGPLPLQGFTRRNGGVMTREGVYRMVVDANEVFLPLGWTMSQRTKWIIENRTGADTPFRPDRMKDITDTIMGQTIDYPGR